MVAPPPPPPPLPENLVASPAPGPPPPPPPPMVPMSPISTLKISTSTNYTSKPPKSPNSNENDESRDQLLADIRKGVTLKKCGPISKNQPYIARLMNLNQHQKTNGTASNQESSNSNLHNGQSVQSTDAFHTDLLNALNNKAKNATDSKEKLMISHGQPNFQITKRPILFSDDSSVNNKNILVSSNGHMKTAGQSKFNTLPRSTFTPRPNFIKCDTVQRQLSNENLAAEKSEESPRLKGDLKQNNNIIVTKEEPVPVVPVPTTPIQVEINNGRLSEEPKTPSVSENIFIKTELSKKSQLQNGNQLSSSKINTPELIHPKTPTSINASKSVEIRNESPASTPTPTPTTTSVPISQLHSEPDEEISSCSIANALSKFQTLERKSMNDKAKKANWSQNTGHRNDLRMAQMISSESKTKLTPSSPAGENGNGTGNWKTDQTDFVLKGFATLPKKPLPKQERQQTKLMRTHPAPNYVIPTKVGQKPPSPAISPTAVTQTKAPFSLRRTLSAQRGDRAAAPAQQPTHQPISRQPSAERTVTTTTSFARDLSAAPNRYPEKVEIRTYVNQTEDITFDNVKLNRIKFDINLNEASENTMIRMVKK